ncbi:M16 family metallopeptidase [Sphingobacterium endophyticum]|uniref:M16 family metallopeptidase n=1 Tax=Sphingobacterium endophyticum TaxID=2546448 RepID=UPI0012E1689D|nr:pitrilysin family protein [Sphingobacterium endophyticum]
MDHKVFQLENGLRILFQPHPSTISHVCLIVDAGSRHEEIGKFGTAHFIEHLLFKRTERRSTNQILNRLESVGGDLNAYTTKEYTCVHASFLNPYLSRALDLFEDILFHSIFPEDEMDKEKEVILDEMASYLDSPEESIMDDFEDLVFQGSGLGHNILGLEEDLKSISQKDIKRFIEQHYDTSKIVIAISGNYTEKKVLSIANKCFGDSNAFHWAHVAEELIKRPISLVEREKPINQAHVVLGGPAYGIHDPRKTGLLLLNNLLGGYGMSNILNLNIREKYGIAYTIESNYSLYSDTGLFSIYFGTDDEKVDKTLKLVGKELKKLMEQELSAQVLERCKNKFKGQIALAEENRMSLIIAEAKNILDYDRVVGLQEVFDKIDQVNSKEIREIANDVFCKENLSSLSFLPED